MYSESAFFKATNSLRGEQVKLKASRSYLISRSHFHSIMIFYGKFYTLEE